MKRKYKVNLLLKKKKRPGEDVVYFLLHYFRYILVITQIIIIVVFFYRLKVDQEIVDLNDTLRQQREIIAVLRPFVDDIRKKYARVEKVKLVIDQQETTQKKLDYILSVFPADFYLTRLTLDREKVVLEGKSVNYLTIMRFQNRLRKDKRFVNVDLQSVKKQGSLFAFTFELSGFKLRDAQK